ncbi:MAG: glycosyltransferase family 4 protein [Lacipirellulaceae bacterium]
MTPATATPAAATPADPHHGGAPSKAPGRLAVVCHQLPPYRLHLHRRLAAELREAPLLTIATHLDKERRWGPADVEDIDVRDVSHGDRVASLYSLARQLREWRRGSEVIDLLRRENVAAVICNGYDDLGRLRVLWWCWRRGVVSFVWSDSNVNDEWGKSLVKRVAKQALLRPIGWFVSGWMVCGSLGEAYWERFGGTPERTYYVPYEPDYSLVEGITAEECAATAERYRLAPDRRRLIYSGRFVPEKRIDLLLDAFAQLAVERPNWDLVIAGDGELRDVLAARVPAALRSRVVWTGFLGDQAEVSRLYRVCDALVLPSEREPWALVVNEGAAAGLAMVVSHVVGAGAELVRDGVNGRRFTSGSSEELLAALREVTDGVNIDRYKLATRGVLADWRERADPVNGVRRALRDNGVFAAEQG